MPYFSRSRPQLAISPGSIPPGAQPAVNPSPSARTPFPDYAFELSPPAYDDPLVNPWDTTRPRVQSMNSFSSRPPSRSATAAVTPSFAFPEPQIYRSSSARPSLHPQPTAHGHRPSRSDVGHTGSFSPMLQHQSSVASIATVSSYNQNPDDEHYASGSSYEDTTEAISRSLADFSLDSDEGLLRFQSGELPESEQEWHRLVPPEAREALGKEEVQRQSVIFEVVKSEREYVADLEAIQDVYIQRLRTASPPIIPENKLQGFISEVFGNLHQILAHHQQMLGALFSRQREQHPLVQSVADIVLDTTLQSTFRPAYESYIKHYPLSESHHRSQLRANPAYAAFIQSVSHDPRVRKRDLITFLSRPVTRLPRLNLLLEQILKLTPGREQSQLTPVQQGQAGVDWGGMDAHPDLETLPMILGILSDTIKSTQPGIEAAEGKVKFWNMCESLVFQKGEIIDMDPYDESRTLVYSGPVSRKTRTETGLSTAWNELVAGLLDNYFILAREEKRPNQQTRRVLVSRPIPLPYLRLGSFTSPPETKRERADDSLLRYTTIPLFPFTIYHASGRSTRRYTLYVASETVRGRWREKMVDAIGVGKVRMEGNMYFDPRTLSDGVFRVTGKHVSMGTRLLGRVSGAVPFYSGGRRFIAIACASGIYASPWGEENFRKVLSHVSPTSISALQTLGPKTFNKFIVHAESGLLAYSLDILARVALGQAGTQTLLASMERIGGADANIVFCREVVVGQRMLLIYASKRRLGSTLLLNVLEAVDSSDMALSPKRTNASMTAKAMRSFREFGEPGFIPKDAYDVTALVKTIGICTHDGIVIADPTNLAKSAVTIVPDLDNAPSNLPMANLKARTEGTKPLGLVRVDSKELLVIYDTIGCYITKHGVPTRSSGYIKWETQATSYAHRNGHLILFSPEFIEVRDIATARIVQVIEGQDIRLLYSGPVAKKEDPILVVMRGEKDDKDGVSERIVELAETSELAPSTPALSTPGGVPSLWDEWDM